MARRIPTYYVVRRPLTLWGQSRVPGDIITREEAKSLIRIETLVRAGRIDEKFDEAPVNEAPKPKRTYKKAAPKVEEPVVEEPAVEDVVEGE